MMSMDAIHTRSSVDMVCHLSRYERRGASPSGATTLMDEGGIPRTLRRSARARVMRGMASFSDVDA
jgi:hypothetical protein